MCHIYFIFFFFFFKQKTAYEMRISDWSSDVCYSDLAEHHFLFRFGKDDSFGFCPRAFIGKRQNRSGWIEPCFQRLPVRGHVLDRLLRHSALHRGLGHGGGNDLHQARRSEEHTSELQSLMRNSYAVFCLEKKKK